MTQDEVDRLAQIAEGCKGRGDWEGYQKARSAWLQAVIGLDLDQEKTMKQEVSDADTA